MESINGINPNTYNLLFDSYNKHTGNFLANADAIADISIYTLDEEDISPSIIKKIIRFKKIRYSNLDEMYKYRLDNNQYILFGLASDILPFLSEKEKKELLSKQREGRCFLKSIYLSSKLRSAMVLFGTITVGDYQHLHTVVQFISNGNLLIVDWTRNLVMYKNEYEKLFDLKVINRVSGSDIIKNYYLCSDIFFDVPLSVYLSFNQELVARANTLTRKKKIG
jgi:SepF-like predicted cell division protein (DUF552 family)